MKSLLSVTLRAGKVRPGLICVKVHFRSRENYLKDVRRPLGYDTATRL